jgi:hypothetical protein
MSEDEKPLDPVAARLVARIRLMMLIAGTTTLVAIGAVLFVIGYRLLHVEGSEGSPGGAGPDVTAMLPKGARVSSTAVAADQLVVTLETAGGAVEIRTFSLKTLKPTGRLRFATEP